MTGRGPLDGVRVIDLGGIGPGPFATMMFADLGAEVVRIEPPHLATDPPTRAHALNRGKRSVVLDLKSQRGAEAALALVERADMLVEGFRPGVTERLGLGPDACLKRNPALVYGRMTGWGQSGPLAALAGHDINYIGLTGALASIGPADGPPVVPLNLLGDFGGGGVYLAFGMLAALHEADRTGRGQVVDAAIVDGVAHMMTAIHDAMASGEWEDTRRGVNIVDGGAPFYDVYRTSDGRYMAVGALEPKFYANLLRVLEINDDPARQADRAHWPRIRQLLAERFASRTQQEWVEAFRDVDACVTPVLTITEAASHPHLVERSTFVRRGGAIQATVAPRLRQWSPTCPPQPGMVGADTARVLRDWGVSDADALLADRVAIQTTIVD